MNAPQITYAEFDGEVRTSPITQLTYAEWVPMNADDKGYGSFDGEFGVHGDGSMIPDEVRLELASLILPEGYTVQKSAAFTALVDALKLAVAAISGNGLSKGVLDQIARQGADALALAEG